MTPPPPPPYLCLQILEKVLLRLPVKSLIRFKCVCKDWQILISDPDFAKAHLNHRRQNRFRSRSWLCKINHEEEKKRSVRAFTKECEAIMNGGGGCGSSSEYFDHYPFDDIEKSFKGDIVILNSCDGLVCVGGPSATRYGYEIVLWNPSTRQHYQLPAHPEIWVPDEDAVIFPILPPFYYMDWYAFGYDSSSDDYKVVTVSHKQGKIAVDVFSLKSNQWKRFRVPELRAPPVDGNGIKKGVILHGVVHWMNRDRVNGGYQILAFDFEREDFREMALGPPPYPHTVPVTELMVEGGCLCFVDYYDPAHLRVMKDYGLDTSWTRIDLPYARSIPAANYYMRRSSQLLQSLNDQHYLLRVDGIIVTLYDRSHNRSKTLFKLPFKLYERDPIALYEETLISPHPPPKSNNNLPPSSSNII